MASKQELTDKNSFHKEGLGQIIWCINLAHLLGVIIDKDLWWHQHVNKVAAASLKLLMAMNRLTRPSFGLPTTYMR
jgi:hypothetical protein